MLRILLIFATALAGSTAVAAYPDDARGPEKRIYQVRDAATARQVARWECKPLVIHFVPDNAVGGTQLRGFYADPMPSMAELLDDVVIVVVPTERYAGLARQLGVTGPGGYRTISAYDLSAVDAQSAPTCRSGFT